MSLLKKIKDKIGFMANDYMKLIHHISKTIENQNKSLKEYGRLILPI
jgi:hypothetical protein